MNAVMFIVGIFVGVALYYISAERKAISGEFIIDFSDPMKDVCTFVLHEDINIIYEKKQILLDVKAYGADSQN